MENRARQSHDSFSIGGTLASEYIVLLRRPGDQGVEPYQEQAYTEIGYHGYDIAEFKAYLPGIQTRRRM